MKKQASAAYSCGSHSLPPAFSSLAQASLRRSSCFWKSLVRLHGSGRCKLKPRRRKLNPINVTSLDFSQAASCQHLNCWRITPAVLLTPSTSASFALARSTAYTRDSMPLPRRDSLFHLLEPSCGMSDISRTVSARASPLQLLPAAPATRTFNHCIAEVVAVCKIYRLFTSPGSFQGRFLFWVSLCM